MVVHHPVHYQHHKPYKTLKTRTKLQYVPTVLLDQVINHELRKHIKKQIPKIQIRHTLPVVYKMISTEEWKAKEELRKQKEQKDLAKRNAPKGIYAGMSPLEKQKHSREYYIANRELILAKQRVKKENSELEAYYLNRKLSIAREKRRIKQQEQKKPKNE